MGLGSLLGWVGAEQGLEAVGGWLLEVAAVGGPAHSSEALPLT